MLDAARKKRSVSVYEISGSVSDAELSEILAAAKELRTKLASWIEEKHPDCAPDDL